MRLLSLLSFYDETPATLARHVASLVDAGVDHLLALDGPYALYPHHSARSAPEQTQALIDVAHHGNLGITLHQPAEAWAGNELHKRTTLFRLAHALQADWLLVLDTDMVITAAPQLRDQLEQTAHDVAEGVLYGDGNERPHRMLFRAQPTGIQLGTHHAQYLTGDGRTLWNPCHTTAQEPAQSIEGLRVEHRPADRPAERNERRNAYYETARVHQIESTTR